MCPELTPPFVCAPTCSFMIRMLSKYKAVHHRCPLSVRVHPGLFLSILGTLESTTLLACYRNLWKPASGFLKTSSRKQHRSLTILILVLCCSVDTGTESITCWDFFCTRRFEASSRHTPVHSATCESYRRYSIFHLVRRACKLMHVIAQDSSGLHQRMLHLLWDKIPK